MQWHLLFCLSQFIVHLFTFLLILWLCSVGGLGALFLGSPARCNLLVFGLFQRFMACCGLFWFGRLYARLFHLHGGRQAKRQHTDGERERERRRDTRTGGKQDLDLKQHKCYLSAQLCPSTEAGEELGLCWFANGQLLSGCPEVTVPQEPAEPIVSRSGLSRVNRRGNIISNFINFCIFLWLQEGFCKPTEDCLSLDWKQRNDAQDKEAASYSCPSPSCRRGLLCLSLTYSQNGGKLLWDTVRCRTLIGTWENSTTMSCFYSPKTGRTVTKIKGEQKPPSLLHACPAIPLSPHTSKHSSRNNLWSYV